MIDESSASHGGDPAAGTSLVWREHDGTWRWRWTSPGGSTELVSHRSYDDAGEATASARAAYPTSPTLVPDTEARRRRRRTARMTRVVVVVSAGVLVVRRLTSGHW